MSPGSRCERELCQLFFSSGGGNCDSDCGGGYMVQVVVMVEVVTLVMMIPLSIDAVDPLSSGWLR